MGAVPASLSEFLLSPLSRAAGGQTLPSSHGPGGLESGYQRRLVGLLRLPSQEV